LNSSFYTVANSDEVWKFLCQTLQPNIHQDFVKSISSKKDRYPMWNNYYFTKTKKFHDKKKPCTVEKFIEHFPKKFRGIYVTTAVDDSVKNVLAKTFDDFKTQKENKINLFEVWK
jgi:hypothetical protein